MPNRAKRKKVSAKAKAPVSNSQAAQASQIWAKFYKWLGSDSMFNRVDERRLFLAYHGNKSVPRVLDGLQATAKKNPSLEVFLRNACIPFTSAPANDGEIIRFFNSIGSETSRLFLSKRGKYNGMFGVSGKVRAALESHTPDADWSWVQQGSKNYFFSSYFSGLYSYLETLKV